MPKILVYLAAVFLTIRLVDLGVSLTQGVVQEPVERIAWTNMPAITPGAAKAKEFFTPPPQRDISPESQREIDKLLADSWSKKRYVLYEFYAPWSDPCKRMESTSLSNDQVDSLIDKNFTPIRVTDRLKETGKNPRLVTDLQKKFRVFAFPTLVIVDPYGEPAASLVGNCSSLTTYRFLTRTLFSLDRRHKKGNSQISLEETELGRMLVDSGSNRR